MTDAQAPGAFTPVDSKVSFPEMEKRVRSFWEEADIFRRSVEERPADNTWVFYEGPPTANGLPHMGHVIQRTLKDLFPRFHTMRGARVVRKAGWDTHGLPVEIEVEKELGLTGKKQVDEYGIDAFNKKCRESVFRYIDIWTEFTNKLGLWLDLDHPYVTYESSYTESVWAILKRVWDRGLLYKGYRVVPYCPRCATPLSSHELSLGYQDDIKDPSVYPLFELADEPGTYFLAWTTTPWTLPGNVALAVGPKIQYVKVENGDRKLILAEDRLEVLDGEYEVLEKLRSSDLVGKTYRSLYDYMVPEEPAFFVVEADFVSVDDGTGIVHTAAAYGEDDLKLAQDKGIPIRHVVDLSGRFYPEVEKFAGQFVKDADVPIMVDLSERGLLYKKGTIRHTYPFCWRCGTPLPLLRDGLLVHPHVGAARGDARHQPRHQLVPPSHPGRADGQLAGVAPGLVPVPAALLGHPAADLGMRELRGAPLRGICRRARPQPRRRPPPAVHRRGQAPLRQVRRHHAPGARPDRCLV